MKKIWKTFLDLLDKHADDLANFSGGLFVLSLGCIGFALIAYLFESYYEGFKLVSRYLIYINLGSLVMMGISLWLTLYCADRQSRKEYRYVLNFWSIETLRTAGVGNDIIKFLEILLKASKEDEIEMTIPSDSTDNWLNVLEANLGATRVEEFRPLILKYTRRNPKISAPDKDPAEENEIADVDKENLNLTDELQPG